MNTEARLIPVREAHRFDQAALTEYLKPHLDGFSERFDILQFEGGQSNPTFLLDCGAQQYVLRKKPPGKLPPPPPFTAEDTVSAAEETLKKLFTKDKKQP